MHALPLSGFGYRTGTYERVEVPLEANALLLRGNHQVLIISLDTLYIGPLVREHLLERLKGHDDLELVLCASHTHFAPSCDPTKPRLGTPDEDYLSFLCSRLEELVDKLLTESPTTGTLHYGEQITNHFINRRRSMWRPVLKDRRVVFGGTLFAPNEQGPRDDRVRVAVIRDKDSRLNCVLWTAACHPVGAPSELGVNSEYPGIARKQIRDRINEPIPILFLQGFSGNIRPRNTHLKRGFREFIKFVIKGPTFSPFDAPTWRHWAATLAKSVDEAVQLAESSDSLPIKVTSRRQEVPLEKLLDDFAFIEDEPKSADSSTKLSPQAWADKRRFSVCYIELSPRLTLLGLGAEPVVEYSTQLKTHIPGAFTLNTGYIDDVFGYLPTNDMIGQGGYEDQQFFPHVSLRSAFPKDISERVEEIITQAIPKRERAAYSQSELAQGLRQLGLVKGDLVLVRASLRALGPVSGNRSEALIEALREVLGSKGTIVAHAFNHGLSKFRPKREPVVTLKTPPYSGGFAASLVNHPESLRSKHPSHSFVALGRLAEAVTAPHDENAACFSPMQTFLDHNGKEILVGCVDSSPGFSTVHFVQEQLGLSYKTLFSGREALLYDRDGKIKTFWRRDISGCSMGFGKFYPHYIAAGVVHIAHVGDAFSYGISARNSYTIEHALMRENKRFALCDQSNCIFCRGSLLYNWQEMPKCWVQRVFRTLGGKVLRFLSIDKHRLIR